VNQNLQKTKGLVESVFDKVFDKYDLMNDLMSLGAHRLWKRELLHIMRPSMGQSLIDVACGTGDIAKLFSGSVNNNCKILCIDSNQKMIDEGKKKLINLKNINWKKSNAENLRVSNDEFDFYSISFGLRNTKDLNKSISEAYRVLKKGGKFVCLEFSKINNSQVNFFYKKYSQIIPLVGQLVVGDKKPYEYLIKSIDQFVSQEELLEIMKKNKFKNCKCKNLSGGIVAIHYGWKI